MLKLNAKVMTLMGLALSLLVLPVSASAGENWGNKQVGERRSGYTYAKAETRAIQDDDFANPAFLWVDQGESLWSEADGKAGKSCQTCHGDASVSMKGVGQLSEIRFSIQEDDERGTADQPLPHGEHAGKTLEIRIQPTAFDDVVCPQPVKRVANECCNRRQCGPVL